MTDVREGWGFPGASRKAHYFRDSATSLCGRWFWPPAFTSPAAALEGDTGPSKDDCAPCRRKVGVAVTEKDQL